MEMESEFINDQMEKLKILKDNNNKDGNNTLGKIPNGFCENAHKLSNGINLANDKNDDKNVPVDKCNANKFTNETLENSSNGNNKNITNELEIKNKQGIDDVATLESEIVSKCNNIESNSKTNTDDVVMMSLDSNNSLFMRPKPSNETAIFADQNLPAFLEDSLNEQLSKIVIDSDEDQSGKVIEILAYEGEKQLPDLMTLISKDLSEPYSVYTYRYFLHNWPELSFLAYCDNVCVGAIVCKLDQHRKNVWRGYIAMLVVHGDYRRCKIGTKLVQRAIRKMINQGCDEVVLETEVTNKSALKLYENLGFIRDKRLLRYYLNGVDAWRLKLWLK